MDTLSLVAVCVAVFSSALIALLLVENYSTRKKNDIFAKMRSVMGSSTGQSIASKRLVDALPEDSKKVEIAPGINLAELFGGCVGLTETMLGYDAKGNPVHQKPTKKDITDWIEFGKTGKDEYLEGYKIVVMWKIQADTRALLELSVEERLEAFKGPTEKFPEHRLLILSTRGEIVE